jgi:hypothetical protein
MSRKSLPHPNGPEEKQPLPAQVAEILRQRPGTGNIRLAAHGILDRAIAAHECCEKILKLAFARIAPPDAQALAGGRGIDINTGAGRQLRNRIDLRHVDPVCAEIDRNAEVLRIGQATSAGATGRFVYDRALAGRRDAAGGRDPGRAGADDRDVRARPAGLAKGRRRGKSAVAARNERLLI